MLLCFSGAFSKGYRIRFSFPKAANQNVILAHYYTSQILINDTVKADGKGAGIFSGDSLLPQGLYKIYLDSDNHFDFLLSSAQDFELSGPDFSPENIKIKGAAESEEFLKYILVLAEHQKKRKETESLLKNASESEKQILREKLDSLSNSLQTYWKDTGKKYPGTWLSAFLMANYVPVPDQKEIPENISKNDSLLLRYKFNFQRKHFFDYFEMRDERFLYTPLVKQKIETFFTKVLFQSYDSVKTGALALIEYTRPSKKMFQFVTSYFLNSSINSNIMGMDALFADIARKYYLSGEAFWADSTTLAKIRENLLFVDKNLIGMQAPELKLEGIDGEEFFSLNQVKAPFTLVLIYEPNCSHCKEFVPRLHDEVYRKYHGKGFEVYAVYSMDDKKEWADFVEKHQLYDWINVWDPHHLSGFKISYDARKTPGVYLLNKDKKIIAKKLSVEQIGDILGNELK